MIDFAQLQEIMQERLERDRAIQYVEAVGPTLEIAVSDAAALLDIPVRRLEYEIMEKGAPGFWGMGRKEWRIQAYERYSASKKKNIDALFEDDTDDLPVIENKDGEVFVFLQSGGQALLKVTAALGNGRKASETYALQFLNDRKVSSIDTDLVRKTVQEGVGEYIQVGEFEHHSYNDSVVRVEIAEGDMHAFMSVKAPEPGGCDITFDSYINTLNQNNVKHGIKEDFLHEFIDQPIYNERVEIAIGTHPHDGKDAYIHYNFETDMSKARLREGSDGRVDFKELNIIQNVVENQPLAKMIPPEKGIPGMTVTRRVLPAKDGKETTLPVGTNVHVSEDKDTILASISGQVVMVSGLVNVEPVYTVEGDVSLKTGNIEFNGTVMVTGNVEDGFSIKAAGNIEIKGSVARAELDAEGDIIIHQGINSKSGGMVRAGKSIVARFIQNANIHSGDTVIASDGIINSYVVANNRIICQGKRASIMGGRLCASEEINAKVLGNPTSGTETILEVGFDPKSKEELDKLQMEKETTTKLLDETKLSIQTLVNIKQQRKSLPEDKEAFLEELMEKRNHLVKGLEDTEGQIKKIQEYLNTLKARGKVSASAKVYPGVKIVIRDVREEVHTEYKAVTFVLEDGLIKVTKYEEPDAVKGPDGYTTN